MQAFTDTDGVEVTTEVGDYVKLYGDTRLRKIVRIWHNMKTHTVDLLEFESAVIAPWDKVEVLVKGVRPKASTVEIRPNLN